MKRQTVFYKFPKEVEELFPRMDGAFLPEKDYTDDELRNIALNLRFNPLPSVNIGDPLPDEWLQHPPSNVMWDILRYVREHTYEEMLSAIRRIGTEICFYEFPEHLKYACALKDGVFLPKGDYDERQFRNIILNVKSHGVPKMKLGEPLPVEYLQDPGE